MNKDDKRVVGDREKENIWEAAEEIYAAVRATGGVHNVPFFELPQKERDHWFEVARLATFRFRLQLHLEELAHVSAINSRNRYQKLAKARLAKLKTARALG
jgi:hypothetical protein